MNAQTLPLSWIPNENGFHLVLILKCGRETIARVEKDRFGLHFLVDPSTGLRVSEVERWESLKGWRRLSSVPSCASMGWDEKHGPTEKQIESFLANHPNFREKFLAPRRKTGLILPT